MHFEQASEQDPTVITYKIQGNDPSAERGMHIHQFGDNTNGCTSAGPHCMFPSSTPPYSQGRENKKKKKVIMLTRRIF